MTSDLQCELETRQHELCDKKVTIEALTRELHIYKKELEMKQQEVVSAKIEASNLVRYVSSITAFKSLCSALSDHAVKFPFTWSHTFTNHMFQRYCGNEQFFVVKYVLISVSCS